MHPVLSLYRPRPLYLVLPLSLFLSHLLSPLHCVLPQSSKRAPNVPQAIVPAAEEPQPHGSRSGSLETVFVRDTWGAFSHSARTAPIITLFIPGTPLKTTHLQKHA